MVSEPGGDVVVELLDDGLRLAVPAEDEHALGRGGQPLAMRQRAGVRQAAARIRAQHQRVVVFGDRDHLVAAARTSVSMGGLSSTSPLARMMPMTVESSYAEITSR